VIDEVLAECSLAPNDQLLWEVAQIFINSYQGQAAPSLIAKNNIFIEG